MFELFKLSFQSRDWMLDVFAFNVELIKAHYLEHYTNTNKTMVLSSPSVPMRPDVCRHWTNQGQNLVSCNSVAHRIDAYAAGNIKYIWNTERLELSLTFSTAMLITLTGIIGTC